MFRGTFDVSLDDKSRVVMPSRYRDDFKSSADAPAQLVITLDVQSPCLCIYPLPEWEEIEAKLSRLPTFREEFRRLKMVLSLATDVDLDASGRFLVPPSLREHGSLQSKKSAKLVGQQQKLQLWDKDVWEPEFKAALAEVRESQKSGKLSGELLDLVL